MTTLILAFGLYIIGVATILYVRPKSMFRENTWKEFGLSHDDTYTIFPFWLFIVVWAIISYVFASIGNLYIAKLALLSVPQTHKTIENIGAPVSSAPPNTSTPTPGYYIVQTLQNSQQPQFVYFGTSPPTMKDLGAYAR